MRFKVLAIIVLLGLGAGCLDKRSARTVPSQSSGAAASGEAAAVRIGPTGGDFINVKPAIVAAVASPSPTPTSVSRVTVSATANIALVTGVDVVFRPALDTSPWWCKTGTGFRCTDAELADPVRYRQVLVLPTGFTSDEYQVFRSEFNRFVTNVVSASDDLYAGMHKDQILFVGYWMPGGALGTMNAIFGGRVAQHPIRGKALTLRQGEVFTAVDQIRRDTIHALTPWSVMILFNSLTEEDVTANAAPAGTIGKPYGVGKVTRTDLGSAYVPVHEMAHASLNFLDEYQEPGLEEMNIRTLDYLTPLALLDGSWGSWITAISNLLGVYDYKISEILAANGNDNVDTSMFPSRVATQGYTPNAYEYEGGMFFGRGTFHDRGKNIMNSDRGSRAADDGFAYLHSGSQQRIVESVFDHPGVAARPNDRIRNAGPLRDWAVQFGSTTRVMLFDADKHHEYQRTTQYNVQVGWYDRHWKTCWQWGVVPYPCYDDVWTTAEKTVTPVRRGLQLKGSGLFAMTQLAQRVACELGYTEVRSGEGTLNICAQSVDQVADTFVPTLTFNMPYQEVSVPASQWFTTYFWRFSASNGTNTSGQTGWTSFYRVF